MLWTTELVENATHLQIFESAEPINDLVPIEDGLVHQKCSRFCGSSLPRQLPDHSLSLKLFLSREVATCVQLLTR